MLLLLVLLTPARGQAQALSVPTEIDPCVPIDREKFLQVLAIELDAAAGSATSVESGPQTAAKVSLTCVDDEVLLTLDDAVTRKSMTRRVELQRVDPSARTRLMALTVAELVLASWLELRMSEPRGITPVGPPPPPAVVQRAAQRAETRIAVPERLRLGLGFELMAFTSAWKPITSVALYASYPLAPPISLRLSFQLGWTTLHGYLDRSRERQPVDVDLTTGSLLLGATYDLHIDATELSFGLGGRFGLGYFAGRPGPGVLFEREQSYAPWGGPVLLLGVGYHATSKLRLRLALELGFVALRARATAPDALVAGVNDAQGNVVVVTELSEAWGNVALGFDWAL